MKKLIFLIMAVFIIMAGCIGPTGANAFELREAFVDIHSGKISSFENFQSDVSDWHRLNVDLHLKADIINLNHLMTVGIDLEPSVNLSQDFHLIGLRSEVYVRPFDLKWIEVYGSYEDVFDTRNVLSHGFSVDNNVTVGARFGLIGF